MVRGQGSWLPSFVHSLHDLEGGGKEGGREGEEGGRGGGREGGEKG